MYNRAHHTSVDPTATQFGPTLQHPKPVAPPYPLPSSPSPPVGYAEPASSASSQCASGGGGGASAEYQRFAGSSPPAHQQQTQGFYAAAGGGAKGAAPDVYMPPHYGQIQQQQQQQQQQQRQRQRQNMQSQGMGAGPSPWAAGAGLQPGVGAAFGVNDATAAMGMQFGQSAMRAGHEYVERNITRYLPVTHLKHSFNVSNSYVLSKLRTVLFPWRHRPWSRMIKRSEASGQAEGYRPPREDINSPDAYIPVMAFTTYVLLSGVVAGSKGQFDPQLLSYSASKALGIIFLEFCCIKLGCYLLNIAGEGAVVDLLAYSGYKFVGIVLTLLASLCGFRSSLTWAVFIYVFCANAFFLLRSLRYVILPDASASFGAASTSTVTAGQKARRIQFLFAIAVSQLGSMWILSRT